MQWSVQQIVISHCGLSLWRMSPSFKELPTMLLHPYIKYTCLQKSVTSLSYQLVSQPWQTLLISFH